MLKHLLAAAATAGAIASSAFAGEPIFVLRPPTVPSAAKVLPMDAFSAIPSTPNAPGNPSQPSAGYDYKSKEYDLFWNYAGIPAFTASISLSKDGYYIFKKPSMAQGCEIAEAANAQADSAFLQNNSGVGLHIRPKNPGHYLLLINCLPKYEPGQTPYVLIGGTIDLTVVS